MEKKIKRYCTQNNGDCDTCSLVNYGRDCHNHPLVADPYPTKKIEKEIKWATITGKIIIMQHVTARENISDHNYMVTCDDIDIYVDGTAQYGYSRVVDHPTYGKVIQVLGAKIYIAPEVRTDVIRMDADYNSRLAARLEADRQVDKDYQTHYNRINNAMTLNGTSM